MSRQRVLLLVCTLLFQLQATMAWKTPALTPPDGYSLSISAKVIAAKQKYTCDNGLWIRTGSAAELLDSNNTKIGSFKSVYDCKTKHSNMSWTLINSVGDRAESGYNTSSISGTPVYSKRFATDSIPEMMCEVTSHQNLGTAARVSFVVLTQTQGGLPPNSSLCTMDDTSIDVPFAGIFEFYTQDPQPPANTPKSITPNGRFVQGLFVEGKMVFRFDGKTWLQKGVIAMVYDVAGGNVVGTFGTVTKPDKYGSALHWNFNNPNGFWLTGKLCAAPVKVSEDGCQWQLMAITSTGGSPSPLGPYKYVLLTSSRGGLPPTSSAGATPGQLWNSPFSGIFWLYTTP